MANLPSLRDLEHAIYEVFYDFDSLPGDFLSDTSIQSVWSEKHAGFSLMTLQSGLDALVAKAHLKRVNAGYLLTDAGFSAIARKAGKPQPTRSY